MDVKVKVGTIRQAASATLGACQCGTGANGVHGEEKEKRRNERKKREKSTWRSRRVAGVALALAIDGAETDACH